MRHRDTTSRRSLTGRFTALPHTLITSPAFRSLRGSSVKVFLELHDRYFGYNNGELVLSFGDASKLLCMSKSTVGRAYNELTEKGLIRCTSRGNWYEKMASTWALTHHGENGTKGSPLATNEWRKWKDAPTNGKAFHGTDVGPDRY